MANSGAHMNNNTNFEFFLNLISKVNANLKTFLSVPDETNMLISDNILVQTNTLLCEYILKTMPVCGYYIHYVPCIEICFIS